VTRVAYGHHVGNRMQVILVGSDDRVNVHLLVRERRCRAFRARRDGIDAFGARSRAAWD
jgi:hypothetical protein